MNREYHKWYSPHLARDMELLVFGHAGAKVLVFPTRTGRFYEYEELRMIQVLASKIEQGWLQLYCVDGVQGESFYCWWAHPSGRIQRHVQYEQYVLNEVLPFMQARNDHPCTIAHGCSLGAYHAVNIAFRHPHLFRKVAAFSGRYDLTLDVDGFSNLFDGYYDSSVYFHMPSHFLPGLSCEQQLGHLRNMDHRDDDWRNRPVSREQPSALSSTAQQSGWPSAPHLARPCPFRLALAPHGSALRVRRGRERRLGSPGRRCERS